MSESPHRVRTDGALNPGQRAGALRELRATTAAQPLDLLIVGGGVVGNGAALDAAARGLRVGLIEMQDLAAGTSSRSSRLAHGGLRYLEQREFSLVHEALTERGLLLDRLAPHLVRPVPFLFPVAKHWQRPYVASGIRLYDLLSRVGAYGGSMPRPKSLTRDQAKALAPDLDSDHIAGAVRFHDAQIDDARHTVALARTAASFGAQVATRVMATGLLYEEDQVIGVIARDTFDPEGPSLNIYARCVVGAAGVWTDDLIHQADAHAPGRVQQSKGVHLVVPASAIRSTTAIIARTAASVLFLLPWGKYWLIGTTDTPWGAGTEEDGDPAEPVATSTDIDYLLEQANHWLARPITRNDVVATYAGLRPLLAGDGESDETTTLSREHSVFRPRPGLILIAGGKYTTYRVMACDVVDAAVDYISSHAPTPLVPLRAIAESTTQDIPLSGADGYAEEWAHRAQIAAERGMTVEAMEGLLRRHGDRMSEVFAVIDLDPTMAEPLNDGMPYLRAEVVVAVTKSGALSLDDVLTRRLRVTLETEDHGVAASVAAAPIMAKLLQWSPAQHEESVREFARNTLAARLHETSTP